MKTQKIIWMADEAIGNTKPTDWESVMQLTRQLIQTIGSDDFTHEVLDPRVCFRNLVRQIQGETFTTVIDLTGMFGSALQELFPDASIVEDFKMSRIREVSSHGLPTTGHLLSLTPEQLRIRKQKLNLDRVLIVDDTSFSGSSSEIAMKAWGLPPSRTSHAFLLANTGHFPTSEGNIPGAVTRLERLGSKVFFGQEICTPQEDGWHTKDLHDHPQIHSSFEMSIMIQQLAKDGRLSEIEELIQDPSIQRAISSECFGSAELTRLQQEGRITISRSINESAVHARNPLLWAIPALGEHIDIRKIIQNKDLVVSILSEIQGKIQNPEGKRLAQEGFRREASLITNTLEGVRTGGERL